MIGIFEYIIARLTCEESYTQSMKKRRCWDGQDSQLLETETGTGLFLNLHCGHNNQYSLDERERLIELIRRQLGDYP